jgi:hypothetical protein
MGCALRLMRRAILFALAVAAIEILASVAPNELTAIGTVGAFGVALYLLRVQILDRRAEANDRRTVQARLVAAWLADLIERPQVDDKIFVELVVLVYNGSAEPVYGVVFKVEVGVRGSFVRRPFLLGPQETREFRIIAPGLPRGQPAVSISFKDSAGRQWMRSSTGVLYQPMLDELLLQNTEESGAYAEGEHPTHALGQTLEAQRGQRVS